MATRSKMFLPNKLLCAIEVSISLFITVCRYLFSRNQLGLRDDRKGTTSTCRSKEEWSAPWDMQIEALVFRIYNLKSALTAPS